MDVIFRSFFNHTICSFSNHINLIIVISIHVRLDEVRSEFTSEYEHMDCGERCDVTLIACIETSSRSIMAALENYLAYRGRIREEINHGQTNDDPNVAIPIRTIRTDESHGWIPPGSDRETFAALNRPILCRRYIHGSIHCSVRRDERVLRRAISRSAEGVPAPQ